jgi:hypothetical protein
VAESFDIVLSESIAADDLITAIAELIPSGLRVELRLDLSEFPDEPGAIWGLVGASDDPTCLACSTS